ncbi:MAG TPA: metal ABC transporter permease [Spirochaetales bacterium]|nr:metal ABC transporter permease [Spirochaetales bacterium]HRY54406.1 metal ABC transporter permease [Spirochaetia bacterium]HRZ64450.1 metal ABC transporter permease [Spirochaetia bacterium]
MSGFLAALLDPGLPFIRNALAAGLLSSILFGVLGSVVTVKRIAGLAGAVSHAVLGGVGLALFLSVKRIAPGLPPIAGAIAFALVSALLIAWVSLKAKQREDTVINAIWAIGMSLGVLFIAKTPGYIDPMSYLFGNILLVSGRDLLLLAILDALVLAAAWLFYPQLEASAFDEEFARTRGARTDLVFLGILAVVAVAVVLLQTFVGIVMVIAMLTLPAGTAGFRARNLAGMMVGATALSAAFSALGLAASWSADLPAGATVVVIAGASFLAAAGARGAARALARGRGARASRASGGPGDEGRGAKP